METQKPDAQPERETAKTEKQGGESQKGPAAPPPVTEPPHSEAKERDAEEAKDKTDRAQDEAIDELAENTKLIAQQTKWEKMQGQWTRNQFWAALGLGMLTLCVLFYQSVMMSGQLESMKSSSDQTQEMIRAMQKQANASQDLASTSATQARAMQGQLDAMQAQADTLKASLEETRKAANAATTQANASQTQAKASVAQAEVARQALGATQSSARATEQTSQIAANSFALTQQPNVQLVDPTISALEAEKHPVFTALIMNSGAAPINSVISLSKLYISPTRPPLNFPIWDDQVIGGDPGLFIPAGGKKLSRSVYENWALSQRGLDVIKSGRTKLYILGEIRYRDGLGRRWHYRYCAEYVPADSRLLGCGESNSLQEP
jgi:hypothetical protein